MSTPMPVTAALAAPSGKPPWAPWLAAMRHPGHLPRDARDTLFHLFVTGWAILPHAGNLPAWCLPLAYATLLWRAHLALANRALPGRWVVAAVLLLAVALTWMSERTLLGKEAGVSMVVVLIALKTLELRARRDAMVTFFLGFFLVLTHFLYSQSMLVALSMLVSVWGLLTALVLSNMPVGRPPLAQAAWIAARAALLGAPVMVALFVLFPRIGPLWGVPQDAAGRTGLSGSLRLGGVAELANDESIAFRVRFFGPAPAQQQLYFRGPVLATFNGREWTRQNVPALAFLPSEMQRQAPALAGAPLRYEMTVEPSRLAMLPLLELTPQRADSAPRVEGMDLVQRPDLEWVPSAPIAERVRFEAQAWLNHRHGPRQLDASLAPFLQLPASDSPRTREWVRDFVERERLAGADTAARVLAVLEHIRRTDFSYTLEPGPYGDVGGANAIDGFWLDRRQGFCEHYAASFVFVMRLMRVPARIVTGYQGSDRAPVDGYHIVRQSHAHAWTEVWMPDQGWQRVDPTAAVAPERVSASRALAPTAGFVAGALANVNPAFAAQLRTLWEALNNRWNQRVLNFSRGTQFELLKSLGVRSPSWVDLGYALAALVAAAGLAGAVWAWWDRTHQDPWQRLARRVQRRLAMLGVAVAPHHDPRARATAVRAALGARAEALAAELDALDRLRYAAARPPTRAEERAWWQRFAARCAALPVPPAGAGSHAVATAGLLSLLAGGLLAGYTPDAGAAATKPKKAKPARAAAATRTAAALPTLVARHREAVSAFAAQFSIQHDVPRRWVDAQLGAARLAPAVRQLIMPPPAGVAKNWAAYRARFIEPRRIAAGVAFWREHRRWLAAAQERWGVPPQIVAAIIGVETFYGSITGNFRVLDALATLAFDFPPGRRDRSEFFRSELEELLLLSHREGVAAASWRGSYAGAIGWPQFMPGSINRWAVDFDEDGHTDLQRSVADAIGSVAHYLAWFGWRADLPTHYAVTPPTDDEPRAMLLAPDIVPSFSAAQFESAGAALPPEARGHDGLLALVELHNGSAAPSWVAGTRNFYVITRYNWSSYYAMAVIELAEALQRAMEAAGG